MRHSVLIGIVAAVITLGAPALASADARSRDAARATLARAYLRADQAYMEAGEIEPGERRRINRAFDVATTQFFSGDLARAAASLASLASDLSPPDARARRVFLASLQGQFTPGIALVGVDAEVRLTLTTLFDAPRDGHQPLTLTLAATGAAPAWRMDLDPGSPIPPEIDLTAVVRTLEPMRYELRAAIASDTETIAHLDMVAANPAAEADALAQRLDAIHADDKTLGTALSAARSRLEILSPNADGLLRMLHPLEATRREIEREVASLEAGLDPYAGRAGHLWASLPLDGREVALRLYVPAGLQGPAPLLIALHGAGGNEHLFPEAYGGGEIIRLADEFGFIVVAPATYQLIGAPRVLTALIDSIDRWTEVDRDRVYALGHSLGGITASSMARQMRQDLAAACCLAGIAPLPPGPRIAPLLVVSAQFDPIIPLSRIEPVARRLISADEPVVFRVAAAEGHTLMVGPALRESVRWLLSHRRPHDAAPLAPEP